jgi:hypothetical protein
MKINLELVRHVMKDALGFDSFAASFISEVREDRKLSTAGITKDGKLSYSPEFVAKYVKSREDLFCLLFHEMLHPAFAHFIHASGDLENIACDSIINAVISQIYSSKSKNGSLFRRFYEPKGIDGILRPNSKMSNSRYSRLYEYLYSNTGNKMTAGEVIQTLKILAQGEQAESVVLLGTHGADGIPLPVAQKILEEVKRELPNARQAGYSELVLDLLMEALKTCLSIKKVVLKNYLTKRKIDRFRQYHRMRYRTVSPIPVYPSKRDLALISADIFTGYFHNKISRSYHTTRGMAIYLDVSGSVNEHLPEIIGILRKLRDEVTTIFQFSNQVVETEFKELLKGKIKTTYGTDFDCVAMSILDNRYDKAVVITDGYASLNDELGKKLKASGVRLLTIIYGGGTSCDELAQFGDIVLLRDMVE